LKFYATASPYLALAMLVQAGADLFAAYLKFKRAEMASLETLDETEICRRYAEVY
jgi:hypothetical protein